MMENVNEATEYSRSERILQSVIGRLGLLLAEA